MTFAKMGFLSSDMIGFRNGIRDLFETRPWFIAAGDLNTFVNEILLGHKVDINNNQRLISPILLAHAHQSFQAAVILSEFGMLRETRAMTRIIVENAIAGYANSSEPTFVDQLLRARNQHFLSIVNEVDAYRVLEAAYSADKLAELRAWRDALKIDAKNAPDDAPKKIDWSALGLKYCPEIYHVFYRDLSADGVHLSVDSVLRCAQADDEGNINSLLMGPRLQGTVSNLKAACYAMVYASDAFLQFFDYAKKHEELLDKGKRAVKALVMRG